MTWMDTLVAHLKQFEGLRLRAYDDFHPARDITDIAQVKGTLTIGHGHTGADVFPTMVISETEADRLLAVDMGKFAVGIARLVKVSLTANERVALISLAYNIGLPRFSESTLLEKLNAGDRAGAADEFPKWRKSKGEIMPGLVRRRAAERTLFLAEGKPIMKNQSKWAGMIRHFMTIVGAAAVSLGYADEDTMMQIVGGVVALFGLVWSWVSPAKKVGAGDPE